MIDGMDIHSYGSDPFVRMLADNLSQRLFVKDLDLKYIFCNTRYAEDLGTTPEAIIGKDDFGIHRKEIALKYRACDRDVLASGEKKVFVEEYYIGQAMLWVRTTKTPFHDRTGRVVGVLGIFEDITEQEELERSLRLKDQAIETAVVGIAFGDTRGVLTYVNRKFLDLWGAESKDDVVGRSSVEFWADPNDAVTVISAISDNGFWSGEMRARRLDGTEFTAMLSASTVSGKNGVVTHMMATFIDISYRVKTQEIIRTQAEQFTVFKETIQDGFWLVNNEGRINDANQAAADMLGYTIQELKTLYISDIEANENPEKTREHIDAVVKNGSDLFQTKHRTRTGEEIDVEVSTSFWPTKELLFAYVRDITRRVREEEELHRLRLNLEDLVTQRTNELNYALEAARKANQARTRFLSKMSHELRTPLNAIIGFSQLLELDERISQEKDMEDIRQNIREVLEAGNHLLGLIDTMLEFAQSTDDLHNTRIEQVECGDILAECVRGVGRKAEEKQVHIDMASESLSIRADRSHLRRILKHILTNAVEYNRTGGSITITCRKNSDRNRIVVEDTGIGIAPEHLGMIFEPFERTETQFVGFGGVGIGLAMSRQLAEEMGGTIGVESTPGEGSTFWVELPAGEEPT